MALLGGLPTVYKDDTEDYSCLKSAGVISNISSATKADSSKVKTKGIIL